MNKEPIATINICFHMNTIKDSCLAILLFLNSFIIYWVTNLLTWKRILISQDLVYCRLS